MFTVQLFPRYLAVFAFPFKKRTTETKKMKLPRFAGHTGFGRP